MEEAASPMKEQPCSPSSKGSPKTLTTSSARGKARIAAGGEASGAAAPPAMSASFIFATTRTSASMMMTTFTSTGYPARSAVLCSSWTIWSTWTLAYQLETPTNCFPEFLCSLKSLRYLNLSGISFQGELPPQLGNLSSLQYLDILDTNFGCCRMYSKDLSWLRQLSSLRYLGIPSVNLSTVVDWVRLVNMIPSLRVLVLPHCSLASAEQSLLHLNFTKLEELDLSSNSFHHLVASSWFWGVKSLKYLRLSANHLYGKFPDGLGNMTSLEVLDFSYNSNKELTAPNLASLCNLEVLDLGGNSLHGDIHVVMEKLPRCAWNNLQYLGLSDNHMTGNLPNWIGNLTSLGSLDLSSNRLSGHVSSEIGALSNLTDLDLSNNSFNGVITEKHFEGLLPENMEAMPWGILWLNSNELRGPIPPLPADLDILDISMNSFSGPLPSNFGSRDIETLIMFSNNITGSFPTSMCQLQSLVDLDLSNNALEGEIPQCFQANTMKYLLLSNNSLSGEFPMFIQNCTELVILDLARNVFSGSLPTWVGDLANLEFILLSHNMYSGNIPSSITRLKRLQLLDLASNNLSGAIPQYLANLTSMTLKGLAPSSDPVNIDPFEHGIYDLPLASQFGEIMPVNIKGQELKYGHGIRMMVSVDLSCNRFTGRIPEDVSSLDALINLNLSMNELSGDVPGKIGAMQSLESLDLTSNKLSGEIPSSLSNLTYLIYLNLSYNRLSGRIPSGHQLDTLNVD
ncbi:LRR receptor-like serine/threonine-protein kinase FLS2 [Triticum aestivum]|nr:LRR receptor-like serine/threonine-protein kinase FLS2 [Triticum aestivum]